MTEMQTALLAKADRALASAQALLHDDPDAAANRAYNACFDVARAALLSVEESPKTHAGVHTRFAFHFTKLGPKSGPLDDAVASTLPYAAQQRERADYEALGVTDVRGVADLVADAERFVAAVRPLVRAPGEAPS